MVHVYVRIRQWVMSKVLQCLPQRIPTVVKGSGSILQIPYLLKKEKITNVEIITTHGFVSRGTLKPLMSKLEQEGIGYTVYSGVNPDPTISNIEEAAEVYHSGKCQAIVAVGGGSVIDCAKITGARIARPNKSVYKMAGVLKIMKKIPMLLAVPTTAGTGSEVTAGAVITEETNHYKITLMDLCLVPRYAVLDPELTCTLSKEMTAISGIDALTHGIEAYVNRFRSAIARESALKCVKLLYHNLRKAYKDGQDIEARENLLLGAYYGGLAINNAYIGYAHAIGHGIGGLYGVPHGKAVGVLLPYILRTYGEIIYKELAELADAVGLEGSTQKDKALRFIDEIEKLTGDIGLPKKLLVVKKEDIQEIIRRAKKEAHPTYPVPIIWDDIDFKRVIEMI